MTKGDRRPDTPGDPGRALRCEGHRVALLSIARGMFMVDVDAAILNAASAGAVLLLLPKGTVRKNRSSAAVSRREAGRETA